MALDPTLEQSRLLIGVLMHVSRYLSTGCPRAAHQAGILLRCLDNDAMDEELMISCEQLDLALPNSAPKVSPLYGMSAGRDASTSSRLRSRSSPASVCSV